ncbi:MAG: L-aspartate oxidase [Desulfobulbaceae bacterium]|uniref:L-aspartate oxidase n=1 Tax=Candidatus Desulfatifera sulfidica TaxID=2841691 RepID=A0A8J6N6Z3_9BACT|nr:L-aspartate oxidase [Candidatus Desulfatifera sulfidica]
MDSDFLIIGTGIAGLSFALRVADLGTVTLITKKKKADTATNLAQGGIAAVLSADDSKESHELDTIKAGAGLCHHDVVKMVVDEGPDRVRELMALGVHFVENDQDSSSGLDLGREGGHSHRRVAHAYDLTGHEIEQALLNQIKSHPNVTLQENHSAIDLLMVTDENGKRSCSGAYVLDEKRKQVLVYRAHLTTLCTGGTGKVYLYTTNPDIATGDGLAMAFRAGAVLANLEFVQFHPTCLYHHKAKNFLISEAVRGEGGILKDHNGVAFMAKYDPRLDLATRDTVARAIDQELKSSGADCVFLDITHKSREFLQKRFPTIFTRCLELGIDISQEPIPVVPAAHYMCGGVETDLQGCTSITNLLALGETACTGLHGGNRLASNSLLEGIVYAKTAADYCHRVWSDFAGKTLPAVEPWKAGEAENLDEEILINHNWDQIRRIMWNYVGIVRKVQRLELAQVRMREICREIEQHYWDYLVSPNMLELRNIALISHLIIQAALARKESRGLHYLLDFPEQNNEFLHDTRFYKTHSDKGWRVTHLSQPTHGEPQA